MKPFSERLLDLLNDGDIERAMTHEDEDCIREAAALAKRYEDAPVAELYHQRFERTQYYGELYAEDLPEGWTGPYIAIDNGQRVRILLDTEGE
jgi:hypothetical protein